MARAAVPGRLKARRAWRAAALRERRMETLSARTLVLRAEGWPGHLPGQHVDVRLTADDGYQAIRSYSLAAPADGDRLEIMVQRTTGGEVSPFLTDELGVGEAVELRGPLGGWFVWRPEDLAPVLLVAGGSGVVPLMAMVRARADASAAPFRLISSVRTPEDRIYLTDGHRNGCRQPGVWRAWDAGARMLRTMGRTVAVAASSAGSPPGPPACPARSRSWRSCSDRSRTGPVRRSRSSAAAARDERPRATRRTWRRSLVLPAGRATGGRSSSGASPTEGPGPARTAVRRA